MIAAAGRALEVPTGQRVVGDQDGGAETLHPLGDLAKNPQAGTNVKKLIEHPGYRLRVGDWRVVYLLDHGRVVVQVIRIAKRSEV